jgi:partitioning defective protein 6
MFVLVYFQLDAEFRRFPMDKSKPRKFDELYLQVEKLHRLKSDPFVITYSDKDGDLLPINNDDNFNLALQTAKHILRVMIQRKGMLFYQYFLIFIM